MCYPPSYRKPSSITIPTQAPSLPCAGYPTDRAQAGVLDAHPFMRLRSNAPNHANIPHTTASTSHPGVSRPPILAYFFLLQYPPKKLTLVLDNPRPRLAIQCNPYTLIQMTLLN